MKLKILLFGLKHLHPGRELFVEQCEASCNDGIAEQAKANSKPRSLVDHVLRDK
jgi:hypothetical protein